MTWRKVVKWTSISVATLVVIVLLLFAGVYFALRSPGFYQYAITKTAPYLQRSGIEIKHLGSARIDLFHSIKADNVQVRWRDRQHGEVDLGIGSFSLNYSLFSLLSKHLLIDQMSLTDLKVQARLNVQPSAEQPPQVSAPVNWDQFGQMLGAPPLLIQTRKVNVTNVVVDIRLDNGQHWQQYKASLQHAGGELIWRPDSFQGQAQLQLGQTDNTVWNVIWGSPDETLTLDLTPRLTAELAWEIDRHNDVWRLQQATLKQHAAIQHPTLFRLQGDTKHQVGTWDTFTMDITSNAKSTGKSQADKGLLTIFPIAITADVKSITTGLEVQGLKEADFSLDTKAEHQLQLSLEGELHPFEQPPPRMQFKTQQELKIDHLDAKYKGQQASIKDFSWHLNARGDTPVNTNVPAPVNFDLQLDSRAQQIKAAQEGTADTKALQVSFHPEMHLEAAGQLSSLADLAKSLTMHFQPQLTIEQLAVRQGQGKQTQHYRITRQQLSAQGDYDHGRLTLHSDLALDHATIPPIEKEFSLHDSLDLDSDMAMSHPQITTRVTLDKKHLFDFNLQADNQADTFSLQHTLQLELIPELKAYPAAAEILNKAGYATIAWTGQAQIIHHEKNLQDADVANFDSWPMHGNGQIVVTQKKRPKDPDGIVLAKPVKVIYGLNKEKQYQTDLSIDAPGIQLLRLKKSLALLVQNQSQFTWPLTTAATSGKIDVNKVEAIHYQLTVDNKPKQLKVDSRLAFASNPDWQQYLPQLKPLETVGKMQVDLNVKTKLEHPNESILEFDPKQLKDSKANLTLDAHIKQSPNHPGTLLHLPEPANLEQNIVWSANDLKWNGRFFIAAAELPQQLALKDISGELHLTASPGMEPEKAKLSLHVDKGQTRLLGEAGASTGQELGDTLTPLNLNLAISRKGEQVALENMQFDSGAGLLALQADGTATLDGKNAQLESTFKTQLRPNLLTQPSISGNGSLEVPWRLTMVNGKEITVEGQMLFNDLSITAPRFKVENLNGNLKIEEELLKTREDQLKFRYLIPTDPFQRVDFSRIQPYLDVRPTISIGKIEAGKIVVGPGLTSILVKQNLFQLQRVDMDVFGGHLTGQLYLNIQPGAWKVGLLSRISQVDLRELLPENSPLKHSAYTPISARTAVEFDINQRLMQGQIDITQISRDQLLQLLEVIDPDNKDEQLAKIRTALRLAYPKSVRVEMRQGLMNLEVSISIYPKPLRAHGLPLTPLIQHFGGTVLEAIERVPLQ